MTLFTKNDLILVTGGSGFIGTHLVNALVREEAVVLNYDLVEPKIPEHRKLWREGSLLDIRELHSVIQTFKPTIIFNLAAHASIRGDEADMIVNTVGVKNLLATAVKDGSPPFIIHASTQLVAGPATSSFDPLQLNPYTLYGESKAESEVIIRKSNYLHWTIARPSNIWGPYHPTFEKEIWRYIRDRMYLHPSGLDVVRSYGYVENAVSQLIQIALKNGPTMWGETFYVGDEPVPSTQWLDGFAQALTSKPVRRVPFWALKFAAIGGEVLGRIGGPSPINLGRLHRMTTDFPVPMGPTFAALGSSPVPFEVGVEKTVSWLRSHEGWR